MKTGSSLKYMFVAIGLFISSISTAQDTTGAVEVVDTSFNCIREMTSVRGFYVDNLLGDIEATVAVAKSATGGSYPPGSVVQLVPGEVMVKHGKGFSPATSDWEFFELEVSAAGSKIGKRGFTDVVNRFGGNCFACHIQAEAQWDMICETGHGCEPIPLTRDILTLLQKTDPRCENNETLSAEDMGKLKMLQQSLQNAQMESQK